MEVAKIQQLHTYAVSNGTDNVTVVPNPGCESIFKLP